MLLDVCQSANADRTHRFSILVGDLLSLIDVWVGRDGVELGVSHR
jgi:hypothetical protein